MIPWILKTKLENILILKNILRTSQVITLILKKRKLGTSSRLPLEISLTILLIILMKVFRALRRWLETFFRRNMIQVISYQALQIWRTHRMRDLILRLKNWLGPESLTNYFKEALCKVMRT